MWKAIVYKEWIKTRRYLFAALLLTAGFAGYGLLRLYRAVELMGAGHIWEVMVTRNAVFIDPIRFVPLLAGLLLAVVQFVPEMQRKCLKLTLHLPVPALATLGAMLAFGLAALSVLFGIGVAIVGLGPLPVIARELAGNILCTALPWFLAGMAAYLLGAWVILEPTWRLPRREHPHVAACAAPLLPRGGAARLRRIPAPAGAAHRMHGLAELDLGRAVHGRKAGLNPKNTRKR